MKQTTPGRLAAISTLSMFLTACAGSSIETVTYSEKETSPQGERSAEGLAYALPVGLVSIKAAWDGKPGSRPKVSFGDTIILPDPNARYRARGVANALADDTFALTVEAGLMSSVNVTNKDQTGEAIGKVISIAAEAAKGGILLRVGPKPTAPAAAYDRTIVFDPFLGGQEDTFADLGLVVDVRFLGDADFATSGRLGAGAVSPECRHSLCYRDPVAVSIRVTDFTDGVQEGVTLLPDPRVTSGIDVDRTACVEVKSNLNFTKGMLTRVDLSRPSPIVGCLEIPLNVLQRIVQVPAELLAFESGNIDAERALIQAQTNYINALEARTAAQAAAGADN